MFKSASSRCKESIKVNEEYCIFKVITGWVAIYVLFLY